MIATKLWQNSISAIFMAVILFNTANAQTTTWIKAFSPYSPYGSIGLQIHDMNSELLINSMSVINMDNEFKQVVTYLKVDKHGDLIWKHHIPLGDSLITTAFPGQIAASDSTFYLSLFKQIGERSSGSSGIFVGNSATGAGRSTFSGVDSLLILPVDLHLSYDGNFLIEVSNQADRRERTTGGFTGARIQKLSLAGEVMYSENYLSGNHDPFVYSSCLDENNNVYLAWTKRNRNSIIGFTGMLTKVDPDGIVIWEKELHSYINDGQSVIPKVTHLGSGELAYGWTRNSSDPFLQPAPPVIYYLDSSGEIQDSLDYQGNHMKNLNSLYTASNGDIIGCGWVWSEIGESAWMFRATKDGQPVWERYIQDNRLATLSRTELFNITEGEDGSISATGLLKMIPPIKDNGAHDRIWVVKLDANGCLDPGCTNDTIHLTKPLSLFQVDTHPIAELSISPNPVSTSFTVNGDLNATQFLNSQYQIINNNGQTVATGDFDSYSKVVHIEDLLPGIYYFLIREFNQVVGMTKLIKK